MNGEQLYALYEVGHAEQNCSVAPWEALDDNERAVWDGMAAQLPDCMACSFFHADPPGNQPGGMRPAVLNGYQPPPTPGGAPKDPPKTP